MNNSQFGITSIPSSQLVRQSDQIMRKLDEIKTAIQGRDQSADNLHEYLPNKRISSIRNSQIKPEMQNNSQSYRQSLQKKLQRLFKQQKKVAHDYQQANKGVQNSSYSGNLSLRVEKKEEHRELFTIDNMQRKIRELEAKYLNTDIINHQQSLKKQRILEYDGKNLQKNKTKSVYVKKQTNSDKIQLKTKDDQINNKMIDNKFQPRQLVLKSDQLLRKEIKGLKKQVKEIRQSNIELYDRIQNKERQKKIKRQRAKYLLQCILGKLIDIQGQVVRRDQNQQKVQKAKPKTALEQRQSLKQQNGALIRQVKELNNQLRNQINEKERIQQKTDWIESQLRKNHHI